MYTAVYAYYCYYFKSFDLIGKCRKVFPCINLDVFSVHHAVSEEAFYLKPFKKYDIH